MKVEARLTHEKVKFDQENDAHLVVSLTAPKIEWQSRRTPICVIPVIDNSGSMADDRKLDYAKQSALKLVDHLQPGDFCGLITFETSVQIIAPCREITQTRKEELKAKIGEIRDAGGTNLAGGMLEALEQVKKLDLPQGMIVRIILFTDGQANQGVATKTPDLVSLLKRNLGNATLSAFGYGNGADQDLLGKLAKEGGGNYAFVKNPEDALTAFGKELGGLLSVYAQNIEIAVAPHADHKLVEVVSDVDVDDQPNKDSKLAPEPAPAVKITLRDVLAEEQRHVVMAVKLGKQAQAFPRDTSVFDVTVNYDVLDENGKKSHHVEELKTKVRFVKEGEEQKTPTKEIDQIVALHQMVKTQVAAEEYAKAGDYTNAARVMDEVARRFKTRGLMSHMKSAQAIGASVSSHALYSNGSGFLRSMSVGSSRGYGSSSYDPAALTFMDSMGVATSNTAQQSTSQAFADLTTAPPTTAAPVAPPTPNIVVNPSIQGVVAVPPVAPEPQPTSRAEGRKRNPKSKASKSEGLKKNRSNRW